jgi:hypothetical protein
MAMGSAMCAVGVGFGGALGAGSRSWGAVSEISNRGLQRVLRATPATSSCRVSAEWGRPALAGQKRRSPRVAGFSSCSQRRHLPCQGRADAATGMSSGVRRRVIARQAQRPVPSMAAVYTPILAWVNRFAIRDRAMRCRCLAAPCTRTRPGSSPACVPPAGAARTRRRFHRMTGRPCSTATACRG